jgi:hypothetical protein
VILRRRRRTNREVVLERQPDDLPKRGLFVEPVRVASLRVLDPEQVDDDQRWRVTFLVEIRDAADARCPDLAVEAQVSGPERTAKAHGTTDLLGRIRFRTTGPAGRFAIKVTDVAAGGLDWAADAGPREVATDIGPTPA